MKLNVLKRVKFISGLVLGLSISSMIAYAAVTKPYHFSPGQMISANEINQNFDTLFQAVNNGGGGGTSNGEVMLLELSAPITIVCTGDLIPMTSFNLVMGNNGNYNPATGIYTATKKQIIQIYSQMVTNNSKYTMHFKIDGGTYEYISTYPDSYRMIKLLPGQELSFYHRCDDYGGSPEATINQVDSYMLIKNIFTVE